MVAAYISAKAQEESAITNEDWHAEQVFSLKLSRWSRKLRLGRTGTISAL